VIDGGGSAIAVGRLRICTTRPGVGRDAAFRLKGEALVGGLDLRPAGLPERSVLIVKHLGIPSFDLRAAWDHARTEMTALRRAAADPWITEVDPAAGSVVFADEAELLACLTRDVLAGRADQCWWWRRVVPRRPSTVAGGLLMTWMRFPRWLPAALAQLPLRDAERAVTEVGAPGALSVLQAMQSAFRMPSPRPAPYGMEAVVASDPPWRPWLPAVTAGVALECECLLGVALALHHAPAIARRPTFSRQVAIWLEEEGKGDPGGTGPEVPDSPAAISQRSVVAAREPRSPVRRLENLEDPTAQLVAPATGPSLLPPAVREARAASRLADEPGPAAAPLPAAASGVSLEAGLPAEPGPGQPGNDSPSRVACSTDRSDLRLPLSVATTARWVPPWGPTYRSQLASLLYLVNVVVWLDLTGEWPSGDGAPSSPSTGWAAVERLGRYMLGELPDGWVDDPLWATLAELDGRPIGTPPTVQMAEGDEVRLPPAWLARWSPPPQLWEGWSLQARAGEPWVNSVGAFVAWLLGTRGISAASLAIAGEIAVTTTHVDVVFDIDDVNMAARISGLDRDPGWVPELGRIVLFHFLEAS
jgi:hypothetical protein